MFESVIDPTDLNEAQIATLTELTETLNDEDQCPSQHLWAHDSPYNEEAWLVYESYKNLVVLLHLATEQYSLAIADATAVLQTNPQNIMGRLRRMTAAHYVREGAMDNDAAEVHEMNTIFSEDWSYIHEHHPIFASLSHVKAFFRKLLPPPDEPRLGRNAREQMSRRHSYPDTNASGEALSSSQNADGGGSASGSTIASASVGTSANQQAEGEYFDAMDSAVAAQDRSSSEHNSDSARRASQRAAQRSESRSQFAFVASSMMRGPPRDMISSASAAIHPAADGSQTARQAVSQTSSASQPPEYSSLYPRDLNQPAGRGVGGMNSARPGYDPESGDENNEVDSFYVSPSSSDDRRPSESSASVPVTGTVDPPPAPRGNPPARSLGRRPPSPEGGPPARSSVRRPPHPQTAATG